LPAGLGASPKRSHRPTASAVSGLFGVILLFCFRLFGFIPAIIAGCAALVGLVLTIIGNFSGKE